MTLTHTEGECGNLDCLKSLHLDLYRIRTNLQEIEGKVTFLARGCFTNFVGFKVGDGDKGLRDNCTGDIGHTPDRVGCNLLPTLLPDQRQIEANATPMAILRSPLVRSVKRWRSRTHPASLQSVVCCSLVIFSRFHGLSRIRVLEAIPYDRPTVHGKLRTLSRSKRVKGPALDVKSK